MDREVSKGLTIKGRVFTLNQLSDLVDVLNVRDEKDNNNSIDVERCESERAVYSDS